MPVNIAELERRARRLLTPEVYDYYAGGAGSEPALRANVRAWRQHWLQPRALRDVSTVDTSVRLPGSPQTVAATPVAVAPTGFQASPAPVVRWGPPGEPHGRSGPRDGARRGAHARWHPGGDGTHGSA